MHRQRPHESSASMDTLLDSHAPDHDDTQIDPPRDMTTSPRPKRQFETRLFQRWKYFEIRDTYKMKAKPFVDRLQAKINFDKLPLPFAKRSYERGEEWIKGVILCTWGAGIVLVINIILTLVAVLMAYTNSSRRGNIERAVIYEGRCSLTSGWKIGLHLMINVLSTAMLAASNYVMQCLCAPSRAAIDRVHGKNCWLDIGTLSIRNFLAMNARRKVLWVALLVSSLPVHMLFNSAVFSSTTTFAKYETTMLPADLAPNEAFLDKHDANIFWEITGFYAEDIRNDFFTGALPKSNLSDCYDKSSKLRDAQLVQWFNIRRCEKDVGLSIFGFKRGHSETERAACSPSALLCFDDGWQPYTTFYRRYSKASAYGAPPDSFSMDVEMLYNYIFIYNPDAEQLRSFLENTLIWENETWTRQLEFRLEPFPIGPKYDPWSDAYEGELGLQILASHCLVKQVEAHCDLYLNLPVCFAVITCNMVKLVCMYIAAKARHNEVFLTVGDAVASFLDHPDAITKGQCLLSRSQLVSTSMRRGVSNLVSASIPLSVLNREFSLCLGATAYASHQVNYLVDYQGYELSDLGLGESGIYDNEILGSQHVTALVLLVNTPQLFISILYYICNSIMSSMLAASSILAPWSSAFNLLPQSSLALQHPASHDLYYPPLAPVSDSLSINHSRPKR
ncbi:hypothetical protein BJY04DRAFT_213349 [Aspergillus karnatakaensis]|uniref:uncharacterized protein n=1 Tax=Aspergillus karnatakaensis TaxID=1810916 RepID=UPI003CCDE9F1